MLQRLSIADGRGDDRLGFSELKIKIVAGEFNTMTFAFPCGKTEYVLYISIRRITEAGRGVPMGDGAEGMRSI
jgi:hypothetical protein